MDWKTVKEVPKYNPFMFGVARLSRGYEFEKTPEDNRIRLIENGDVEPTDEEVKKLAEQYDYPISFFQQWWETEGVLKEGSSCIIENVPINYYKYKVFRDLNPHFKSIVSMKVVDRQKKATGDEGEPSL